MCDDRIFAVYDDGIISSFVKHSHVHSEYIGKVDGSVHRSFVRTDDHEMLLVRNEIRYRAKESFHELIGRIETVKTAQWDGVLHARVMGVKSDDIGNSHGCQFLQGKRTVKRFPFGTLVLSALIKKRHDHIDTMSLPGGGGDDPLQILIVIIR